MRWLEHSCVLVHFVNVGHPNGNARLSLQIYPNTMFFRDSSPRPSLNLHATLATHSKNLVKSTPAFGLGDQQA